MKSFFNTLFSLFIVNQHAAFEDAKEAFFYRQTRFLIMTGSNNP